MDRIPLFFGGSIYVISLQGTEGFLLDIDGLRRHRQPPNSNHVIVALLGKIKGEHHELAHLVPYVPTTGSGIDVQRSLEQFINLKEMQRVKDVETGPRSAMSLVNYIRQEETLTIASKKFWKTSSLPNTSSSPTISGGANCSENATKRSGPIESPPIHKL
jgi:hypothetical protein